MKKNGNIMGQPGGKGTEVPVQEPVEEQGNVAPVGEEKPLTLEERLAKVEALLTAMENPAPKDPSEKSTYMADLRLRQATEETLRKENLIQKLKLQEQEARLLYPKLSLVEEAKNPDFVALLKCGVDVRSAFEVIHKDEIIAASMEYAAREVERMMTNKVLSGGFRPTENGGNHGPAVTKVDVKSMTRQERKDMIRRVRMGEKITL